MVNTSIPYHNQCIHFSKIKNLWISIESSKLGCLRGQGKVRKTLIRKYQEFQNTIIFTLPFDLQKIVLLLRKLMMIYDKRQSQMSTSFCKKMTALLTINLKNSTTMLSNSWTWLLVKLRIWFKNRIRSYLICRRTDQP